MAASRVGRQAREVLTADLGERGRRTGQAMPRLGDIPLTQEGFEDPDAYFKSPPTQLYMNRTGQNGQPNSKKRPSPSSPAYVTASQQPPSSANRRQRRPDVTVDIGLKGRKTGAPIVTGRRMPIASNGLEDMDAFFAAKPASIPALKAKNSKRISNIEAETEYDDGQDVTTGYGQRETSDDEEGADVEDSEVLEDRDVDGEDNDDEVDDLRAQRAESFADDDSEAEPGGSRLDYIDEDDQEDRSGSSETSHNRRKTRTMEGEQLSDASVTDNGTKSMDLDGSSYFNKSGRTLGSLSSKKSLQRVRPDASLAGLSPSVTVRNQSLSPRRPQQSEQRNRAISEPSTSSDNDAIQNSLTKSNTAASQLDEAGNEHLRSAISKGKARQQYDDTRDDTSDEEKRGQPSRIPGNNDYDNDDFGGGDDYPDGDERMAEHDYDNAEPEHSDSDDSEPAPVYQEDVDADDQDEEEVAPAESLHKSTKRKRRDVFDEDTDNIAGQDSGHAERPTITTYQKKKKRVSENPRGLRRSERDRTHPLEFWRNEHVVYRRRDSGVNVYYEKIGVEERPRRPIKSLVKKAKGARNDKSKKQNTDVIQGDRPARSASTESSVDEQQQSNWAQWDQETEPDGIVWDYVEGKEMQKRVAFTSAMLDPKTTKHHAYKFQRVFTDGDFMAGGILVIPPNESKPLKPARDNSYILFCHQGAVRVLVHRTEFTIAMGGFFFIPRGNSYQISNLTDIDAVLCFFQSREIVVDPGETDDVEEDEGVDAA